MLALVGEDDEDGSVYLLREIRASDVMEALQKTILHDCTGEDATLVLRELEKA